LLADANVLRAQHQPREAVARANDVLLRDPDGALAIDALLVRAFAQRDIGLERRGNDLEAAASSFGDVVRRIGDRDDPRSAVALLEKGRASEGAYRNAQAALSYDRLLARHDATPVAVASALVQRCALPQLGESRRCVELIRRFGATTAPDVRAVVDAARARLGATAWQHFEELARATGVTPPTDLPGARARCIELTDTGQHVAAIACRDDVRQRAHDVDDDLAYADALARAGRVDDARQAYVAIAKRCPGPRDDHGETAAEACLGQARLLVAAGRPQDALPILNALLASNDVNADRARLERSRAFVALKNDAKALAALDDNNGYEIETLVAKLAIMERDIDLHDVEKTYARLDSALNDAPYSQHATLARGLFEHADAFGRHKDPIGERAGYRLLLDRFGDSTNPDVLQWVDKAAKRLTPP
jgi:tetratricopeptide (TPR) repeat protein